MKGRPLLKSYAGQVKMFLVLLVLFLAVAIYFNFHLLVVARDAIQEEAGLRLGLEADLVRAELERDQMMRGLRAEPGTAPYIPPTFLERKARLKGLVAIEILAPDGRVISSSDPVRVGASDAPIAAAGSRERRRLMAGATVIAPLERLGSARYATIAAYRPIQDRTRTTIAFIRVEREVPVLASVDLDLRTIAALQAGGLAFVLILVIFFVRWLLRPYRRLQLTAGEAPGFAARAGMDVAARDETDELVGAFRGVIDKMREQENELQALRGDGASGAPGSTPFPGDSLIAGMSSAVMAFDRRGALVVLNRAAESLLGIERQGSLGRSYSDLLRRNERLHDLIKSGLATGRGRSREVIPLVGPAGKVSHLGVMIAPIRADAGTGEGSAAPADGLLCLLTDLTEIKALRERVGLKENLAALGEMSAGIAHEFRNSLAVIQGFARLVARNGGNGSGGASRAHAEAIMREVTGVRKVVDDFLRYARPQTLELREIDLHAMVSDLLRDFGADSLSGGIRLEMGGTFTRVMADETLIRQAVGNLLRNSAESLKRTGAPDAARRPDEADGREPRIRVEVQAGDQVQGSARISIEDNGAGIPAADRQQVFTPFFTTKEGGTGLGLALVQKTAILHDGHVEVESEEGVGTCISIVLPGRPGTAVPTGGLT